MFKFALYSLALVGTGTIVYESTVNVASKIVKRNPDNAGIAYGIVYADSLTNMFKIIARSPNTKEELHENLDIALEMKDAIKF